jgi:hypothetical protein
VRGQPPTSFSVSAQSLFNGGGASTSTFCGRMVSRTRTGLNFQSGEWRAHSIAFAAHHSRATLRVRNSSGRVGSPLYVGGTIWCHAVPISIPLGLHDFDRISTAQWSRSHPRREDAEQGADVRSVISFSVSFHRPHRHRTA